MIKRIIIAVMVVVLLMSMALVSCKPAEKPAEKYTVRLAVSIPAGHGELMGVENWIDYVNAQSGGRLTIDPYYGGSLYGADASTEAVVTGLCEAQWQVYIWLEDIFPPWRVMDVPFLMTDLDMARKFADSELGAEFRASSDEYGAKTLAFATTSVDTGWATKGDPILVPEDFAGLRVRCFGIWPEFVAQYGGTPVSVPGEEQFMAYKTGLVNAGLACYGHFTDRKLYEAGLKNHTRCYGEWTTWGVFMNKGYYDKLPSDLQKLLSESALEYVVRRARKPLDEAIESQRNFCIEHGVKLYPAPTPEELAVWEEALRPFVDEFLSKYPIAREWVKKIEAFKESQK